jgi:hypothetical protein
MKTQSELQKAIVEVNKSINKINLLKSSKDLFGALLFNPDEIENLDRLKQSKEDQRNELSHAKRLLSRLERIQRLEHDDRTLEQIADEWTANAQYMIEQQENRIKSAVINDKEKRQQIREASAFYVQEIQAIKFLKTQI